MILERIDTKLNLADHLTKGLSRALFHRHADFILGHIPPAYSPVYTTLIGSYTDTLLNIDDYVPVPDSFTTPTCAAAARIQAPLKAKADYAGNPWLIVLWNDHGLYNPSCLHIVLWGRGCYQYSRYPKLAHNLVYHPIANMSYDGILTLCCCSCAD